MEGHRACFRLLARQQYFADRPSYRIRTRLRIAQSDEDGRRLAMEMQALGHLFGEFADLVGLIEERIPNAECSGMKQQAFEGSAQIHPLLRRIVTCGEEQKVAR